MPIAREHRWLYPIDWRELSNLIRFRRAKGRCEHCRRPHGHDVLHLGDRVWWDEDAAIWRDGQGRGLRRLPSPDELARVQPGLAGIDPPSHLRATRVILASAHLNHDPATIGRATSRRTASAAIWSATRASIAAAAGLTHSGCARSAICSPDGYYSAGPLGQAHRAGWVEQRRGRRTTASC